MKPFTLGVVSLVVFAGSVFGGRIAALISSEALLQEAVVPDGSCRQLAFAEAELETYKYSIDVAKELLQGRFYDEDGGPEPFPSDVPSAQTTTAALFDALGAEAVWAVHCAEYPCVAVLTSAPDASAMASLRSRGLVPEVIDVGARVGLVLGAPESLVAAEEPDNAERRAAIARNKSRGPLRAQALSNALTALAESEHAVLDNQKAP